MSKTSKHIIEKVSVEIEVATESKARELETSIRSFIADKILPTIEKYFDDLNIEDAHVVLDRLNLQVDASLVTSPLWKEEVLRQLDKTFLPVEEHVKTTAFQSTKMDVAQKVDIYTENHTVEIRSGANSNLQAIGYFLATGKAPWWMNTGTAGLSTILETTTFIGYFQDPEFRKVIGKILREKSHARKRFVQQFSSQVQITWILALVDLGSTSPARKKTFDQMIVLLENQFPKQRLQEFWFTLLTYTVEHQAALSSSNRAPLLRVLQKFVETPTSIEKKALEILVNSDAQTLSDSTSTLALLKNVPTLLLFTERLFTKNSENQSSALDQLLDERIRAHSTLAIPLNRNAFEQSNEHPIAKKASSQQETPHVPKDKSANSQYEQNVSSGDSSSEKTPADSSNTPEISTETGLKDTPSDNNNNKSEELSATAADHLAKKIDEDWKKRENETINDGELLDNAGGILLHPFYTPLFSNLKYLDEDRQLREKQRAAHLTHYLITGTTNAFEHEMQFAKFLCGFSLDESIDRSIELTEEEKEQAQNVLKSALSHWTALKSNSPQLLQYEFLQRPGKIIHEGDFSRLIVEKKTVDILLNQLPWNISMVKLPWFTSMLYVEWN